MFVSKRLYISLLCIGFFYAILKSYLNVLKEPSTFQERTINNYGTLPSITFCPNNIEKDNFETIQDIPKAIKSIEEERTAFLKYYASNIEDSVNIDITDSSTLQDSYNTSVNNVWESGVMVDFRSPHPITICTTLNLGKMHSVMKHLFHQIAHRVCSTTSSWHCRSFDNCEFFIA